MEYLYLLQQQLWQISNDQAHPFSVHLAGRVQLIPGQQSQVIFCLPGQFCYIIIFDFISRANVRDPLIIHIYLITYGLATAAKGCHSIIRNRHEEHTVFRTSEADGRLQQLFKLSCKLLKRFSLKLIVHAN